MNSMTRAGLLCLALVVPAYGSDLLDDAKARQKIEAERVEREFTELRASAYRLVKTGSPRLSDALDKLDAIERLLREETVLPAAKRTSFEATLKYDLVRVREIANDRRRTDSSRHCRRQTAPH
ncbi:MAG: hypothetical protein K2W96_18000 [Gemmataceae bacterium]|nr:hypothetical protein [Gemmataceae bacterium]